MIEKHKKPFRLTVSNPVNSERIKFIRESIPVADIYGIQKPPYVEGIKRIELYVLRYYTKPMFS